MDEERLIIWNFGPHCMSWEGDPRGQDLGAAYNRYMGIVPSEEHWAILHDTDAMPCTRGWWFHLCERAIAKQPDAGAFVGVTNRLIPRVSGWQMAGEVDRDDDDMLTHWRTGWVRHERYGCALEDVTNVDLNTDYGPFSGVFILVKKAVWTKIGGAIHGFTFVDWSLHRAIRDAGYHIYLIKGLYLYHWFRHYPAYSKSPYGG